MRKRVSGFVESGFSGATFCFTVPVMSSNFVLHEELLRLREDAPANYYIPNEVAIQGRGDPELMRYLNGSPLQVFF